MDCRKASSGRESLVGIARMAALTSGLSGSGRAAAIFVRGCQGI